MMLQIDHRESRDVDIFLPDPQMLPFLDPQKRDFDFEIRPSDYEGDGSSFLKLAFKDVGEIDFIVGRSMTSLPTTQRVIENERVALETVSEIITKKIYYRGASIRPRIFLTSQRPDRSIEMPSFRSCATIATKSNEHCRQLES